MFQKVHLDGLTILQLSHTQTVAQEMVAQNICIYLRRGEVLLYMYMFGDTTHSVIVDQVAEKEGEDLRFEMLDCFKDINLNIKNQDIKNIERIGVVNADRNKKWPRPVKIIFKDKYIRDQVLFFKLRLRHSSTYY